MVDANSTGLGSAKSRSINVEVNLLNEWSASRVAMAVEVQRQLCVLVGVCVCGFITLPLLSSWRSKVVASTSSVIRERAEIQDRVGKLEQRVEQVTPVIDFATMKTSCDRYRNVLFQEAYRFVEATPAGVRFESLKVETIAGELHFKVVANAQSAAEGRRFVEAAGKGRNVMASNQSAVRQSQTLGQDGVVFDYLKKVKVAK